MRINPLKLERQIAISKLPMSALSEQSGISRQTLRNLIKGNHLTKGNNRPDTVGKLAECLACDISEIID